MLFYPIVTEKEVCDDGPKNDQVHLKILFLPDPKKWFLGRIIFQNVLFGMCLHITGGKTNRLNIIKFNI